MRQRGSQHSARIDRVSRAAAAAAAAKAATAAAAAFLGPKVAMASGSKMQLSCIPVAFCQRFLLDFLQTSERQATKLEEERYSDMNPNLGCFGAHRGCRPLDSSRFRFSGCMQIATELQKLHYCAGHFWPEGNPELRRSSSSRAVLLGLLRAGG
ncbi:hypothetical protein COO60DRAFT_667820 [Scenedesmus sp. NREL 46B-D3]|nr:hypothetical protein COO60DRAFT_667820 [Scenedesmus sp. NREL 46B-D3]